MHKLAKLGLGPLVIMLALLYLSFHHTNINRGQTRYPLPLYTWIGLGFGGGDSSKASGSRVARKLPHLRANFDAQETTIEDTTMSLTTANAQELESSQADFIFEPKIGVRKRIEEVMTRDENGWLHLERYPVTGKGAWRNIGNLSFDEDLGEVDSFPRDVTLPASFPLNVDGPDDLPRERQLNDGKFVDAQGQNNSLYMFSAFWDDRPPIEVPLIRVISVISRKKSPTWDVTAKEIYCYVYCQDEGQYFEISRPVVIYLNTPGKMALTHERGFTSVTVTCSTSRACAEHARRVSIGQTPSRKEALRRWSLGNTVPVETMKPRGKFIKLGTCVPIVYNRIDPYRLVEWFELQKILGVEKVFMTSDGVDEQTSRVLDLYEDEGFLMIQRSHFLEFERTFFDIRVRSTLSVTHCVYAMAYTFGRVMVVDADEIIIPRKQYTLLELLHDLDNDEQISRGKHVINYTFLHNDFILQSEYGAVPDEKYPEHIPYLRYRQRMNFPKNANYHVKSIFDPRHCIASRNHYCSTKLMDANTINSAPISRDIGLDCHFRRTAKQPAHISGLFQEDAMLKYADELTDNINNKLLELNLKV